MALNSYHPFFSMTKYLYTGEVVQENEPTGVLKQRQIMNQHNVKIT